MNCLNLSPDDRGLDCAIQKEEAAAPKAPHRPTESTYQAFQAAYDHFNRELFGGLLPCCLITLQRRGRRTLGYYWAERFGEIGGSDRTDELAMNPQHFLRRPMRETLSTFVHEMTHGWQQHHGKPGRGGYHNKEWAAKMKESACILQHRQIWRQGSRPADEPLYNRGWCFRRRL